MNSQVEAWRVQQYAANVYQLSQQRGSRLAKICRKESFVGKSDYFDRLGLATAVKKTGRNEDTPDLNIDHSRRMVSTSTYHWGTLIDSKDKLQNIHSPENEYSMAAQNAIGRAIDRVIIDAALGNAFAGEAGATSTTLGTAQQVAAVASAVLDYANVQVLRKAKRLLDAAEAVGKRYLIHGADFLEVMLSKTEATSSDYNTIRALVNGEINTFMGFEWIHSQILGDLNIASTSGQGSYDGDDFHFDTTTGLYSAGGTDMGTTEKLAMVIVEGGIILGENTGGRKARVGERDDKGYSNQVYAAQDFGATRMEEAKVVQIFYKV